MRSNASGLVQRRTDATKAAAAANAKNKSDEEVSDDERYVVYTKNYLNIIWLTLVVNYNQNIIRLTLVVNIITLYSDINNHIIFCIVIS